MSRNECLSECQERENVKPHNDLDFFVRYAELFILFLSIPLSLMCWHRVRRDKAHVNVILQQGLRTNGVITARFTGRAHWYLAFSYEHQRKYYLQRQSVFRTIYDRVQENTPATIAYSAENPQEAVLVDSEVWLYILSLAMVFTLLSIIFIVSAIGGVFLNILLF